MIQFSVKYLPTSLFSLKSSSSTNSGAKSLFLPTPFAIKMAILNQAITTGNELLDLQVKGSKAFEFIKNANIGFAINEQCSFAVSNSFVKILKPSRSGSGFGQTVAFREYVHINQSIEIIFTVQTQTQKEYLMKHLHKINYFGKKGCFFQFVEYLDEPSVPNVIEFAVQNFQSGILQEFDDFDEKATFDSVNSYSSAKSKRISRIMLLPIKKLNSSKSYSIYQKI